MAIQAISSFGAQAAPFIASGVGTVIISASLAILIDKICTYARAYFNIREESQVDCIVFGCLALGLGLGALGSYAWTSFWFNGRNFETLAKAANITLSLGATIGGFLFSEYIPNIPVNKANAT